VAGRAGRLHPAWVVFGVTFLVLMTSAAIRATMGVLMVPLEREFGWSRATLSVAVSMGILLYGLTGPFCAAVAQAVGVRRIMLAAMTGLALAVALATRVHEPWQLVALWGLVVGVGTGMTANVLGSVVVLRWFYARRGVVLGALTAATATGQLVFLPVLARLAQASGWRSALWLMAGLAAVMVPLVFVAMREQPQDAGLLPYGATVAEAVEAAPTGNAATVALASLGQALRHKDFWLLAGTFFVCGASTNGLIGTHFIPACIDRGIPEVQAAGTLAVMGVFDLVGTTGSGWLTDRWDSRRLLFTYYGLRGLSLVFLPTALVAQGVGLTVFTVFYGLDWIATVPPTVRLCIDAFGRRQGSIVFGWVLVAHQLGASAAALGAGYTRAAWGDYRPAFIASGMLCFVAASLAMAVGRVGPAPSVGPALGAG
jgi:sugar phosphate permease